MNSADAEVAEMIVTYPYKNLEGYGYISCGWEEETERMAGKGLLDMDPSGHSQWAKLTWKGWLEWLGLEGY